MDVIICGAGQVGLSLSQYLEQQGNNVVLIDQSADLVRYVGENMDIRPIRGKASHPEVLKKAGAENADMIIAVTAVDEVNMVICEVANALFNVPIKIARIRDQAYLQPEWFSLFGQDKLSIDFAISPEVEVARSIARGLTISGAFSSTPMAEGHVMVIGVKCTSQTPIINTPISHISGLFPELEFCVAAIYRDAEFMIPTSGTVLLEEDNVYLVCRSKEVSEVMSAFGRYENEGRRIMLLGGGYVGLNLAKELRRLGCAASITIIEENQERARFVSKSLDGEVLVLCGNALEVEILREGGVNVTETVVAVTGDDKVNALSALLAKSQGAKRVMSIINSPSTVPLVSSLGVDSVIDPRTVTVSSILRHVRQGYINSAHSLPKGAGEFIETLIHNGSTLRGMRVEDFDRAGEIVVAAIIRGGETLFPRADTVFELDDHVIILVAQKAVAEVEKKFSDPDKV